MSAHARDHAVCGRRSAAPAEVKGALDRGDARLFLRDLVDAPDLMC